MLNRFAIVGPVAVDLRDREVRGPDLGLPLAVLLLVLSEGNERLRQRILGDIRDDLLPLFFGRLDGTLALGFCGCLAVPTR